MVLEHWASFLRHITTCGFGVVLGRYPVATTDCMVSSQVVLDGMLTVLMSLRRVRNPHGMGTSPLLGVMRCKKSLCRRHFSHAVTK